MIGIPGYGATQDVPLIRPEGSGSIRVLMMGEAGGRNEAKDQLPFRPYAEAGSVLERALRFCGYDRSQFTITNAVWWQPPHDHLDGAWYEHKAIGMCREWNDELIRERAPKCLLTLGGIPMRELSGMSGHRQGILMLRGYPLPSNHYHPSIGTIPVVGTYHPSYLRRGEKQESEEGANVESAAGRGMDLLGVLVRDIQYAVQIARQGAPAKPELDMKLWGTRESLLRVVEDAEAHPDLPIAWDIENDELMNVEDESELVTKLVLTEAITQIQFSLRLNEAWVFHWTDDLADLVVRLMALPNPKLGFNDRLSDRPITRRFLRDKGHEIVFAGDTHDLMDMWHHSQPDLPKGLQHVTSFCAPELGPWKHLNISDRGTYGALDVIAPQRIYAKLPGDLRKLGIWEGYERHVLKLSRVLDAATVRGIPVNDAKRVEFGIELDHSKQEMERAMQASIPDECKPTHPKEGWKKLPPKVKESLQRWAFQNHISGSVLIDLGQLPDRVELEDGTVYLRREFGEIDQSAFIENRVKRWVRLEPFNPNSPDQIKDYIELKREEEIDALITKKRYSKEQAQARAKYKVPRDFKTDKETTAKRELLRLGKATGDRVFSDTIAIREFGKLKGTYVDGWAPANDTRAHPSFGFAPATSQLSSEEPNAQNVPSEKSRGAAISPAIARLAARFRGMIEAPPGYVLIEADWRSFHALTLGFVAKDAAYMRLARLDIHSYFAACGLLKIANGDKLLAMCDDELREYLAWVKKTHPVVRDGQAKPAILGYGLGMRGHTLWQQNLDSFSGRLEADRVLDALDGQFQIAAAWRKSVLLEALQGNDQHGPNCLVLKPWSIRRFWSVFENKPVKDSYQPKKGERLFKDGRGQHWKVGHGTDAEAAISFYVQNSAHGHLKENLLAIDERGWAEEFGLCNTVHDAFWFCCREDRAEDCYRRIKPQMEAPSKYLVNSVAPEGLWCEVDLSIGKSMASADRRKFTV
jgi:uracil-DNA glycosylase family 4